MLLEIVLISFVFLLLKPRAAHLHKFPFNYILLLTARCVLINGDSRLCISFFFLILLISFLWSSHGWRIVLIPFLTIGFIFSIVLNQELSLMVNVVLVRKPLLILSMALDLVLHITAARMIILLITLFVFIALVVILFISRIFLLYFILLHNLGTLHVHKVLKSSELIIGGLQSVTHQMNLSLTEDSCNRFLVEMTQQK